jgi:hypothetical protein
MGSPKPLDKRKTRQSRGGFSLWREQGIGFDDIVYAPALHQHSRCGANGSLYLIDPATMSHESCAVWQGRTTSADAGDGYVFAADRTHSAVNVIDRSSLPRPSKCEPDIVRYVPATHESPPGQAGDGRICWSYWIG